MYPFDSYNMYNNPYMQGQNFMQNYNQPQPPQQQNNGGGMDIVTVQVISQVEQVQVNPGQRKLIMVQNEPVVSVRVADNMGLVTTDYYQLVKFNPSAVRAADASDMSDKHITKEELEARLEKLVASLNKERNVTNDEPSVK